MSKAFRAAHPEEARAYDSAYYAVNRERYIARNAHYKASTAGILAETRHTQKRHRGVTNASED